VVSGQRRSQADATAKAQTQMGDDHCGNARGRSGGRQRKGVDAAGAGARVAGIARNGAGAAGRPAGLLAKLMAVVRPQFRAEVLVFDPRDPVFGGPACAVPACVRPRRQRGLCEGH
jgi:hypothetical protein